VLNTRLTPRAELVVVLHNILDRKLIRVVAEGMYDENNRSEARHFLGLRISVNPTPRFYGDEYEKHIITDT
jgi:hypothetical protein